jgi:hypothetical protein
MRNSLTIRWLCAALLALIAIALTASTASAQETPVEIWEEDGGHCEPCYIHAVGKSDLEFFGIPITTCEDEVEAEVYEDPEGDTEGTQGHVYSYTNNAATSAQCWRVNCNGVGEAPAESEWELDEFGETGPNEGHFHMDFCLDNKNNPNGAGVHCPSAEIHIEESEEDSHHYIVSVDYVCLNGVHWIGQWETEGDHTDDHDDIEIVHV